MLGINAFAVSEISNLPASDPEWHQKTVRELGERLGRNERFTALPANISEIYCPQEGTPIFVISSHPEQKRQPSAKPGDYVQNQGSFRVVRYGNILGATASEVVVLGTTELSRSSRAWHEVAVIGPTAVQHFESPCYIPVNRAFPFDSGWGFIRPIGIIFPGTTNLDTMDLTNSHHGVQMIRDRTSSLFLTRPTGVLRGDQEGRLVLTLKTDERLQHQEFKETSQIHFAQQGILHLRDGRWLSIGKRLVIMETNYSLQPSEIKLKAVLKAVEKEDRPDFEKTLEAATEYSPEQLQGLIQLLGKPGDPFGNTDALEQSTREILRRIESWHPPGEVSTPQQTQANAVVAAYRRELESFLQKMETVRQGPLGISAKKVGSLIQSGYQYFDGRWIGPPRLLYQESLTSVLLDIMYLTPTHTMRYGIFRLDQDQRLQLLGDYQASDGARYGQPSESEVRSGLGQGRLFYSDPSAGPRAELVETRSPFDRPCQYVGSSANEVLLFFPFQGLGRVSGGQFEWVDISEPFKSLEQWLGTDSEGRIYFVSAPAVMSNNRTGSTYATASGSMGYWAYPIRTGQPADYWVYRRPSSAAPSPIHRLIPIASLPVMDAHQRVWFLPLKPSSSIALPVGAATLGDCPAAQLAQKELLSFLLPRSQTNAKPIDHLASEMDQGDEPMTDLCWYENGKMGFGLTNIPMETILTAGNKDSILGYSRHKKNGRAFLFQTTGAIWSSNLHGLAQTATMAIFDAAPTRANPSSVFVPNYELMQDPHYPSLVRIGDQLWVHHQGRLEVYRHGKPLNLQSRLTLLNCPNILVMHGPLRTSNGTVMALIGESAHRYSADKRFKIFWAIPTSNDVELVRGPEKDCASFNVPLVNAFLGAVYFPRFISPPCFWIVTMPDKCQNQEGTPLGVTGPGELLIRSLIPPASGWTLCRGDSHKVITITHTQNLNLLAESQDGHLICRSPEGVLWLKRTQDDDYVQDRKVSLHTGGFVLSFVGETSQQVFLTVVDARQNAYLAVIQKP